MMLDESLITATASAIFIGLTFNYFRKSLNKLISERIDNISSKYNEAKLLLQESEEQLKIQKAAHESIQVKANEFIQSTQFEVFRLKQQAEIDLNNKIAQRNNAALIKINDAEKQLLLELRLKAIELAINSSLALLNDPNNQSLNRTVNNIILKNLPH